ncbi:hypothetical protein GCM10023083_09190 [Streptomyces phyllanthi]
MDPQSGDAFPVPSDAVQVLFAGEGEPTHLRMAQRRTPSTGDGSVGQIRASSTGNLFVLCDDWCTNIHNGQAVDGHCGGPVLLLRPSHPKGWS